LAVFGLRGHFAASGSNHQKYAEKNKWMLERGLNPFSVLHKFLLSWHIKNKSYGPGEWS